MDSETLTLALDMVGKKVKVIVDRPLGSKHPKWGFKYEANYGYIEGIKAPDGEELDAYVLKINKPLKEFTGRVIAVVHRLEDDDDKLVVVPEGESITEEEIEKSINFQEKWFKHQIITE